VFTSLTPDSDLEAELEVDELDSDSEINEGVPVLNEVTVNLNDDLVTLPPRTKPGERVIGHSLLPPSRVEHMIQVDGVTGSLTLSREALFVLSIATEDFIKSFIQAGHREASVHRRNQINYLDMAAATRQYQEFMFLGDTVPIPMSLTDALMLKQEKERELLEDNPALAHLSPFPTWITPIPEPMEYDVPRAKKNRSTNGKDHPRPNNLADIHGQQPKNMQAGMPEPYAQQFSMQARNSLVASLPPLYMNGTQTPPFEEPINTTSPHLPVHYPGAHSPPYQGEDDSQGSSFTPSGTIGGIVGESAPSLNSSQNNTGRTIYSQSDAS